MDDLDESTRQVASAAAIAQTMAKILLCCENYTPSVGGVQEVMRQIAERTAAAGHQVTVATTAHPDRPTDCVINGVVVKSFAMGGNLVRGMSGDIGSYTHFLRDEPYDVIMIKAAQQITFDAAIDVLEDVKAWKIFIPCGFSGLGRDEYVKYYADMARYLEKFDRLIFYSDNYKDIEFARRAGIGDLEIIPNGVDEREFFGPDTTRTSATTDVPLTILTVGSRILAKGHWEALQTFEAANINGPARLILNGNIPYGRVRGLLSSVRIMMRGQLPLAFKARLANLRFILRRQPRRVEMTNYSRSALLRAYQSADLFLFASHVEYSPLVLFEAAASGTPFVSTDVGNAQEIAVWTGAGIVASPGVSAIGSAAVVERLAGAVEMLLSDAGRRRQMGNNGRRSVKERFCWDTIVQQYWRVMGIDDKSDLKRMEPKR